MNGLWLSILGIIIPTDFHIVQRGWNHQPAIVRDFNSECIAMVVTFKKYVIAPTMMVAAYIHLSNELHPQSIFNG